MMYAIKPMGVGIEPGVRAIQAGWPLADGEAFVVDHWEPGMVLAEDGVSLRWPTDAEVEQKALAEAATAARAKRDRMLSATDWTQIPDAPLTAEQSATYAAYRQALRDVPQQAGFPGVIEWPAVP